MKTRLVSLFLVLVLAGSAFAGIPLHFGGSDCGMSAMMDMDCCKKALLQELTPEVVNAKLCCALNCSQNGATTPPGNVRVTAPAPAEAPAHPAIAHQLQLRMIQFQTLNRSHDPPGLGPVYLQTLALLI